MEMQRGTLQCGTHSWGMQRGTLQCGTAGACSAAHCSAAQLGHAVRHRWGMQCGCMPQRLPCPAGACACPKRSERRVYWGTARMYSGCGVAMGRAACTGGPHGGPHGWGPDTSTDTSVPHGGAARIAPCRSPCRRAWSHSARSAGLRVRTQQASVYARSRPPCTPEMLVSGSGSD